MKIKCLFQKKSTYQEVQDKRRNENQMPLLEKKVPIRKCKTSVEMKIKCLFQRKSTYQEVKDRAKHKPVKQKVPVKKGKREKSEGYDEKKYLLGSERQSET